MAAAHQCKQNAKIILIFGLMGLFLTLVGFAAIRSDAAAQQGAESMRKIDANTKALERLDGNDRDVAVMKQDLQWIKETLSDIKEKIK